MLQSLVDTASHAPSILWAEQQKLRSLNDHIDALEISPLNMGVVNFYRDDFTHDIKKETTASKGVFSDVRAIQDSIKHRQLDEVMTTQSEALALGNSKLSANQVNGLPRYIESQSGRLATLRYPYKISGDPTEDGNLADPYHWNEKRIHWIESFETQEQNINHYQDKLGTTKELNKEYLQSRFSDPSMKETGIVPDYFFEMRAPIQNVVFKEPVAIPPNEMTSVASYNEYAFL